VPIAWAVVPGGGDVEGEGGHYSLRPVGVGGSVHWSCLGLYRLVDSIHDIARPGSRWAICPSLESVGNNNVVAPDWSV
jgi:hypothetical protein